MNTLNINPPQTYQYNGYDVTFFKGDNLFVNATEMAKPFGKRPAKWLELPSTKRFIDSLTTIRKSDSDEFETVRTVNGGLNPGTWLHEDVALEFARWLSPTFAIWCNDRIKELMTNGYAKLDSISRKDLARMLFESEEEKEHLAAKAELQQKELQQAAPKVQYYEEVLQSDGTYNINQIAKELGTSAVSLNKKLRTMGVQYKQNGTWLLYYKYQNKGYTKTRTYVYTDSEGKEHTRMQTVWTEKGRKFIHEITKKHVRA